MPVLRLAMTPAMPMELAPIRPFGGTAPEVNNQEPALKKIGVTRRFRVLMMHR